MSGNELGFWDYLTLGTALLVIIAYLLRRARRIWRGDQQCAGCNKGKCSMTVEFNSRNKDSSCK